MVSEVSRKFNFNSQKSRVWLREHQGMDDRKAVLFLTNLRTNRSRLS